jgi:hypothetical protein
MGLFVHIILAEEFFPILNEADDYDHGGARQAGEKHDFKQPHCKKSQEHNHDCSAFSLRLALIRTFAGSLAGLARRVHDKRAPALEKRLSEPSKANK